MIWGKRYNEKKDPFKEYVDWFAWRPVILADGRWVWWETIQYMKQFWRGLSGGDSFNVYRLKESKTEEGQ